MISPLREALAQTPDFKPELTVVGTTSGGMSFRRGILSRAAASAVRSRARAALIANYTPQKPVIDAQEALRNFRAVPGDRQRLRFRHERDRPRFRMRSLRQISARPHRRLRRDLGAGFRRLRFAPGLDAGKVPAVRSRRSGMVLGEGAAILALGKSTTPQSARRATFSPK